VREQRVSGARAQGNASNLLSVVARNANTLRCRGEYVGNPASEITQCHAVRQVTDATESGVGVYRCGKRNRIGHAEEVGHHRRRSRCHDVGVGVCRQKCRIATNQAGNECPLVSLFGHGGDSAHQERMMGHEKVDPSVNRLPYRCINGVNRQQY
jgi:hypothetical protein